MQGKISHPYIIERKADAIRLTIKPKNSYHLLFLSCFILFSVLFIFHISMILTLIQPIDFTLQFILINSIVLFLEIIVILYFFSYYWWNRKGLEIFTLYDNRLIYTSINKPFKIYEQILYFNKLEIGYQSGEDFYSEEEALQLGIETDLEKVVGNYSIQFCMDDGLQIIDSERKIPVEVIRKIKELYFVDINKNSEVWTLK